MRRLAALALVLLLLAPVAIAHGRINRTYTTSIGASYGAQGFASESIGGVGAFTTNHAHYGVRVTLSDMAHPTPFIAVCIDVVANGFCDDAEGDVLFEGVGSVEGWAAAPFSRIVVFSDTVHWEPHTASLHLSSRGTATVEWLDGRQEPTPPPARERDAVETTLEVVLNTVFGTLP